MPTIHREDVVSSLAAAVYGAGPTEPVTAHVQARYEVNGLSGTARVRNFVLEFSTTAGSHRVLLTVITPASTSNVPLFIGLNFRGNHTISSEPGIAVPSGGSSPLHYDQFSQDPHPRGAYAGRWQIPTLIERGYGLATACYLQLGPDSPELRTTGLFPVLQSSAPAEWGGLGMWAWLLQSLLDVMLQESIGSEYIALGHSRLGKAALWAALQDERFTGVIANNSGCMGASMSAAPGAETPALLADVRPYWFSGAFPRQVAEGLTWPAADQLLAAIAPRHVYVASARDDTPADPAGERAAIERAREAAPDGSFGYHLRDGGHGVTATDWEHFLTFFDRALGNAPASRERSQPAQSTEGSAMP